MTAQSIIYLWILVSQIFGDDKGESLVNSLDANLGVQERYAQAEEQFEVLIQVVVETEWVNHGEELCRPFTVLEVFCWYVYSTLAVVIICILTMMVVMVVTILPT